MKYLLVIILMGLGIQTAQSQVTTGDLLGTWNYGTTLKLKSSYWTSGDTVHLVFGLSEPDTTTIMIYDNREICWFAGTSSCYGSDTMYCNSREQKIYLVKNPASVEGESCRGRRYRNPATATNPVLRGTDVVLQNPTGKELPIYNSRGFLPFPSSGFL